MFVDISQLVNKSKEGDMSLWSEFTKPCPCRLSWIGLGEGTQKSVRTFRKSTKKTTAADSP